MLEDTRNYGKKDLLMRCVTRTCL